MEYTEAARPSACPRRIICPVVQYTYRPPDLLRNLCPTFSHKHTDAYTYIQQKWHWQPISGFERADPSEPRSWGLLHLCLRADLQQSIINHSKKNISQPCPWGWKILMRNVQWCMERHGRKFPSLFYISDVTSYS